MANLTAYIFGTKHDMHNRAIALQTTRVSYTLPQNDMNFGLQTALNWNCILLHCQASLTEISKRNSAKLCQTVDGKWR